MDQRIGQYAYLQPGLGIGGGNIERDLATACLLGEEMGTDTGVIQAFRHNSKYRRDWVVRKIRQECTGQRSDPVIGVWGLAYKADTQSTKNSPALALMQSLPELSFRVYDPEVNLPNSPALQNCKSALEASKGVDILAIMTPWEEFAAIDLKDLQRTLAGDLIVDPFMIFDADDCESNGFRHMGLGK